MTQNGTGTEEKHMANDRLSEALGLLDHAEKALHKIRLETPSDYLETDGGASALAEEMRDIDRDLLDKSIHLMSGSSGEERDTFNQKFWPVNRMFEYLAGEMTADRLPQLKEAPWPPAEWVTEDNMRADAADAEAEPATNGYEEVPDAASADAGADRG